MECLGVACHPSLQLIATVGQDVGDETLNSPEHNSEIADHVMMSSHDLKALGTSLAKHKAF